MKSLLPLIAICAILTVFITSCSKDSNNKPASERILGVWKLDKVIYHDYIGGVNTGDTTIGTPDDKIDFRSDGKVYTYTQGIYDTSAYSVASETKITIDSETFDIETLTDNALTLHDREDSGDDYSEERDYLVR